MAFFKRFFRKTWSGSWDQGEEAADFLSADFNDDDFDT